MFFVSVRLASESDCKDIFEWRNNDTTRKMSFNSDLIKWEIYIQWFNSSLSCKKILLFVKELIVKDFLVKFDINENIAFISINSNPQERGKGLANIA